MLPWTNRVAGARFSFDGKDYALSPNHPDGTAIHGIGRDHPWSILDRSPFSARMALDSRLIERPACPFDFGALFRVELIGSSVQIELSVTNLGDHPMPCGLGHHPYFMRTLFDPDDQLSIRANVGGRYPCQDQIPTGAMVNDEVSRSLRAGGPIGNPDLDDVFGGFDGSAELTWDASKVRCTIECSDALGHLVVFTPRVADSDQTPPPPQPWVCVEPVSMVNDGFNRFEDQQGTGVRVLGPGETLASTMTLGFDSI